MKGRPRENRQRLLKHHLIGYSEQCLFWPSTRESPEITETLACLLPRVQLEGPSTRESPEITETKIQ